MDHSIKMRFLARFHALSGWLSCKYGYFPRISEYLRTERPSKPRKYGYSPRISEYLRTERLPKPRKYRYFPRISEYLRAERPSKPRKYRYFPRISEYLRTERPSKPRKYGYFPRLGEISLYGTYGKAPTKHVRFDINAGMFWITQASAGSGQVFIKRLDRAPEDSSQRLLRRRGRNPVHKTGFRVVLSRKHIKCFRRITTVPR